MKVVLAALNAKFTHTSLALRYLTQSASAFNIEGVEYNINQDLGQITADIVARDPDVLGLSCYIWNINQILQIVADLVLVRPQLTIVLGGPEVSFDVEYWLREYPQIDFIVAGEGEEAWTQLLCAWEESQGNIDPQRLKEIPGLVFRLGDQIWQNTMQPVDLHNLPGVYSQDLCDLKHRIVYYETTRGCPFRCAYCLSSVTGGVREFPLEQCKEELRRLAEADVEQIRFVDRTFNYDPKRAFDLIKFMIELDTTTRFQLEVSGDILTPPLLELLRTAPPGRLQFEIGVQSTNPATLKAVNRYQDLDKLAEIVRFITEHTHVRVLLDLIAGLPEEGFDRFGQSFDYVYSLRPYKIHLGFLKLLRGSKLREEADSFGCVYAQRAPYEVLETNSISYTELSHLHIIEDLVEKYVNSKRFDRSIDYLAGQFGSPFRFFDHFAYSWKDRGYQWLNHSLNGLYETLQEFYGKDYRLLKEYLRWDFRISETKRPTPVWLGGTGDRHRENRLIQTGQITELLPELEGLAPREMGRRIFVEVFDFGHGPEEHLFYFAPDAVNARVLRLS